MFILTTRIIVAIFTKKTTVDIFSGNYTNDKIKIWKYIFVHVMGSKI